MTAKPIVKLLIYIITIFTKITIILMVTRFLYLYLSITYIVLVIQRSEILD